MKKKLCHLILSLALIAFGSSFLYSLLSSLFSTGFKDGLIPFLLYIPTILFLPGLTIGSGLMLIYHDFIKKEDGRK